MIEWRFCGRFSDMSQDAFPAPHGWIDEAEARRRYTSPTGEVTVLPPVDESTGIVPYYIVVGTGQAGFTVVEQIPPGVPKETYYWQVKDGRLFCSIALLNDYPETSKILTRSDSWRTRWVEARNRPDGNGSLLMAHRNPDGTITTTRAKRTDIPVQHLYRPIPDWGHWDDLLTPPPALPEDPPPVPQ